MSDTRPSNFLAEIIESDLKTGTVKQVVTRFPPEPNGFLHLGHAKSILLNFGLARQFGGRTHLRFDDTNPTTEETLYVENIAKDVQWLGADWGKGLYYASDFFPRMFECAQRLIRDGKAYVDSQTVEQIRETRGNFDKAGTNSPFRDRSVEENLALFDRMRAGEFKDGQCVLRAKIDMAHPNVLLRDPLLYRIRHAHHHRTGDQWCIYPMYDYAHPLEDAFEGVTHSICTLEFESNRELYDWVLDNLGPWTPRPHQYEFARLSLAYTLTSKRKLLQLVTEKHVAGWDDPRMPTIAGMRRRGITPEALQAFADLIGVAKNNSLVDIGKFDFAIRQDLEAKAPRGMAVLNPLPLTLTNWPAAQTEALVLPWWPAEPERGGSREVPFGRELLIEREDFSETPAKDWKRLAPGREVRLIGGYIVRCDEVVKDASGEVVALKGSYLPETRTGQAKADHKVAGAIHWVHATRSIASPVRLYDRLFLVEQPDADGDFLQHLNKQSLVVAPRARLEPALGLAEPGSRYQFVRQGYFFADPVESKTGAPVWNRIITLKDTFARPTEKLDREPKKAKEPKAAAAPKKGRTEVRAEQRAQDAELRTRFERYQQQLGLSEDEADVLTADRDTASYFDAAVAAHPSAKSVSKWLLNELLGLAEERALSTLPLGGTGFGLAVALVDTGKLTQAGGKALLAELVARGGEPEARMKELGLEKTEDAGAIQAAVTKVLAAQAAEVARYRSGEKKLFGVLMGAVMRETGAGADAAAVRKVLTQTLG